MPHHLSHGRCFFNPRGSCKLRNGTSCVSGTMTNCNCQVKRKWQMPARLPSTHARTERQQTLKSLTTGWRQGHGHSALVQWCEWEVYQTNRRDIWSSRKKSSGDTGTFLLKTGQMRTLNIYTIKFLWEGFIHSFSILSDDRSKASSKTIPPHSTI